MKTVNWFSLKSLLGVFGNKSYYFFVILIPLVDSIWDIVRVNIATIPNLSTSIHLSVPYSLIISFMAALFYFISLRNYKHFCPSIIKDNSEKAIIENLLEKSSKAIAERAKAQIHALAKTRGAVAEAGDAHKLKKLRALMSDDQANKYLDLTSSYDGDFLIKIKIIGKDAEMLIIKNTPEHLSYDLPWARFFISMFLFITFSCVLIDFIDLFYSLVKLT